MFKKIMKFIKNQECVIRFKWIDRHTYGKYLPDKDEIIINPRLMIVETFIHELMYHFNPEVEEKEIEKMTTTVLECLTEEEMKDIYFYVKTVARR